MYTTQSSIEHPTLLGRATHLIVSHVSDVHKIYEPYISLLILTIKQLLYLMVMHVSKTHSIRIILM